MKELFRNWRLLMVMFSLLLTCFQIQAMRDIDEDIPMEGELGNYGMRSVYPPQNVHAVLSGKSVNIEFLQNIPLVTINIKDTNNTIIYTKTVPSPQYESISLEGLESGCYTLELSADTGYMYGTFMYVY